MSRSTERNWNLAVRRLVVFAIQSLCFTIIQNYIQQSRTQAKWHKLVRYGSRTHRAYWSVAVGLKFFEMNRTAIAKWKIFLMLKKITLVWPISLDSKNDSFWNPGIDLLAGKKRKSTLKFLAHTLIDRFKYFFYQWILVFPLIFSRIFQFFVVAF